MSKFHKKSATASPRNQKPNWFLALQFDNPDIIDKVKIMQNDVITLEPKLSGACVPPEKSHLSLYVFYTQNVDKVIEIVSEVIANYKFDNERLDNETIIEVNGTGNFRNEVVFAKMNLHQKLQELWQNIGLKLVENSIIKSTPEIFTPHLTLFKLSRMDFNERKLKQIRKIPEELYVEKWQDQYFGSQKINSIQLLSRTMPVQENGYYWCHHNFPLTFVHE